MSFCKRISFFPSAQFTKVEKSFSPSSSSSPFSLSWRLLHPSWSWFHTRTQNISSRAWAYFIVWIARVARKDEGKIESIRQKDSYDPYVSTWKRWDESEKKTWKHILLRNIYQIYINYIIFKALFHILKHITSATFWWILHHKIHKIITIENFLSCWGQHA